MNDKTFNNSTGINWKKHWINIIFFINRFLFNMKRVLVLHRPYLLSEDILRALNDKGAQGPDDDEWESGIGLYNA